MKILLTGGAGFIGTHVRDALAAHEVVVFDSLRPDVHRGATPDIPGLICADVRDSDAVEATLDGVDVVVHLAAKVGLGVDVQDLPDYADSNVHGTAVLLAAMARRGVDRLVLASSMVVYGEGLGQCATHGAVTPGPRDARELAAGRFEPPCPRCGEPLAPALVGEDTPADPRNAYAVSKLSQEQLASSWARVTGGSVASLRFHNVYGPMMPRDTPYSGVAAIFRSAIERGEPPRVFEDGGQMRDFIHVDDVAAINVASVAAATEGFAAFNVCSGRPISIMDVATKICDARDGQPPVVTGQYRSGDVRHIVADPAAAANVLGFRAAIDPADGLREFAFAPLRG